MRSRNHASPFCARRDHKHTKGMNMKHTKHKNMNVAGRFLSSGIARRLLTVVLMLLIVGATLASCGSGAQRKGLALTDGSPSHTEVNKMSADDLNKLADEIYNSADGAAIREKLVAAMNGYEHKWTDKENKGSLPEGEAPISASEIAKLYDKSVELTADEKAALEAEAEKRVGYAVEALSAMEIKDAFQYKDKMNFADLSALVDSFKTSVVEKADRDVLGVVMHWIGLAFGWMTNTLGFGSFILGTVYFAILVELLMFPFSIPQQKNSRKQAMLRPKEMAIRKKYAGRNDQATQQKVAQEIQELYTREGFSPMAGCLPLLISLPVVMILYYIVIDPMQYMMGFSTSVQQALVSFTETSRAAGGLGETFSTSTGTIEVLSALRERIAAGEGEAIFAQMKEFSFLTNAGDFSSIMQSELSLANIPDFTIGPVNFGLNPTFDFTSINALLLLVPVLTFTLYFVSAKLNRKLSYQPTTAQDQATGCSNKMMDITMPAMSAFFTFVVPAAVGLYWGFKSILGVLKQLIMSKIMPMPQFTEADYKAAERELAGKDKEKPKKKSGSKNPNVRSLHHIDDDEDYNTLPPVETDADEVSPAEEKPQRAEGKYADGVTLKDDDRGEKKAKNTEDEQ